METIKKIIITALSIVLVCSVGLNVYFLMGKGIVINNNNTSVSNSTSNSYANSGSMSVGYVGGDWKGNWGIKTEEIKVNYDEVSSEIEALNNFLSTLDPVQYMNAKVIYKYLNASRGHFIVSYPEIVSVQKEDHKVKKIVNGCDVK